MIMNWKQRYQEMHKEWFNRRYPFAAKDNFYSPPMMPPIKKSNGLTKFIINYLFWSSNATATRINTMGRLVDAQEKQPSGTVLTVKKFIPSTTRRGTADVVGVMCGKYVAFEIKVGKDRPSEYQLREQKNIQEAGGFYFFTHTPEEFFQQYDEVIVSCNK